MKEQESKFRSRLVSTLKEGTKGFNYSKLARDSNVSRELADAVAEKLLVQLFMTSVSDGVITDVEQAKLDRLVELLEISPTSREQILKRSSQIAFRKELASAHSDGVVTDEERKQLRQLRETLRLVNSDADATGTEPRDHSTVTERVRSVASTPLATTETETDTYHIERPVSTDDASRKSKIDEHSHNQGGLRGGRPQAPRFFHQSRQSNS
jgi:hypothetical protein